MNGKSYLEVRKKKLLRVFNPSVNIPATEGSQGKMKIWDSVLSVRKRSE